MKARKVDGMLKIGYASVMAMLAALGINQQDAKEKSKSVFLEVTDASDIVALLSDKLDKIAASGEVGEQFANFMRDGFNPESKGFFLSVANQKEAYRRLINFPTALEADEYCRKNNIPYEGMKDKEAKAAAAGRVEEDIG